MSRRALVFIAVFAGLAVAVVILARFLPSDRDQAAKVPITVQLQWEPGGQFLGFYVAKQRGLYAAQGLDVRFLHGGPNVDPISNLAQGNAQIGLGTADQVLKWQAGHSDEPLRAFGTVFRRSLAVFMTRQEATLKTPADLRGKRVGVFPSYDTGSLLTLLLKRASVPDDAVTRVNFPNFANFENRELDAFGAYLINEPVLARLRGIPVSFIDPDELGIHFYSDTLIAKRDYFETNAAIVKKFVLSSAQGWALAKDDLPRALEDMRAEVGGLFGPGQAWEHQKGVAAEALKYVGGAPGDPMFGMKRSTWVEMEADLVSIGELPAGGLVDQLCDFSFIDKVLE